MSKDTVPSVPSVPVPNPGTFLKPSCERIVQSQNAELARRAAARFNPLSCRCTLCRGDEHLPIIAGSADAALLNTAYDATNGGFLSAGKMDSIWEVGLGNDSGFASVSSWIKAFVFASTAWVPSPFNNANWISYYVDGQQGGDNIDAYFRCRFDLASGVNPATFVLEMDFYADNRVFEIYVNGVAQSSKPNGTGILPQFPTEPATNYGTRGFDKGQQVKIRLDNSWRECCNEIIVYVKSTPSLMGFLAQNSAKAETDSTGCDCHCDCKPVELPPIKPCISVRWGDSKCDCLETNDFEVFSITVCNCYSNITMQDFMISQIVLTDQNGQPVANLPDGTPSVQLVPSGPICFGDIPPCHDPQHPSCVTREVVLSTRGAIAQRYRLVFNGICFEVCHHLQSEQCFSFTLCAD